MKLIFLGAPGAGKGTIAKMVVKKYGIPQISTGDLFRENIKNGTELGKEAKGYMDKGDLVPDEVTVGMLKERISKEDCKNGYILDGFPRTIPQAYALAEIDTIDAVINFNASEKTIVGRLSARRTCGDCGEIYNLVTVPTEVEGVCDKCEGNLIQRPDDMPESIKNRLVVYKNQTEPLIGFYREKGILFDVDANPTGPEPIFADTVKILEKLVE